MKKLLFVCSIIFTIYSCSSSTDTTSTDKTDKISAPAKTNAPKKDARGNYLE